MSIIRVVYMLCLIFLLSLALFFLNAGRKSDRTKTTRMRFRKNRYNKIRDFVKEQIAKDEVDKLSLDTGLRFTSFYYQSVRYIAFFVGMVWFVYARLSGIYFNNLNLVLFVVIFIISAPKTEIYGRNTPFGMLVSFLTSEFKAKKNRELYRAISQLKNLSIARRNESIGSDYVITEIMKFTNITKPIFSKMLSFWYIGRKEEAVEYFTEKIDTREGGDLGSLFLKLDSLNIFELADQLDLFQTNVKTERRTKREKANERNSNIMYEVVIISAFVVLLNFVVIVLYIDMLNSFTTLFN